MGRYGKPIPLALARCDAHLKQTRTLLLCIYILCSFEPRLPAAVEQRLEADTSSYVNSSNIPTIFEKGRQTKFVANVRESSFITSIILDPCGNCDLRREQMST